MKKIVYFLTAILTGLFFTINLHAQSTIVLDNPDTKPVPVKLINPVSQVQVKTPFTELSTTSNGITTLTINGPASQNEVKVIEYLYGAGVSASKIRVKFRTIEFNYFCNTITGIPVNTFSGMISIVLKKDESVTFSIDGSSANNILVSGYTLK